MSEDESFIYRKREIIEKVKIPEGCIKCPKCDGYGEVRLYYSENPYDRGQFTICLFCHGKGYVTKELFEEYSKGVE